MLNLSVIKNFKRVRKYPAGTVMARSGSSEMIVILKGEAAVSSHEAPSQSVIATLGAGDVFGEDALFLGAPQLSVVVAVTDVFTLILDRNSVVQFIQEEPELTFELMKLLCARHQDGSKQAQSRHTVTKAQPPKAAAPSPTMPAAVPASQPASAAVEPVAEDAYNKLSGTSSLFPEGHGSYQITLNNSDAVHLLEKAYDCPVCHFQFKAKKVKGSKLVVERTDPDMRIHYQGVEPLYYDVVTCPHCLFSALVEQFDAPDMVRADLRPMLQAYQPDVAVKTGIELDTFSVFAGYYLALLCAPKCFQAHHLATAKLWLKLSRVYQDCGDGAMELATAQKALDEYLYVYMNERNTPEQDQQLCVIMGELYIKQGDLRNARDYYFKAKTNRQGSQVLKMQAEDRLAAIKEMEKIKTPMD